MLNREYQFEEWAALTDEDRRKVIHGYWNPYDARVQDGLSTRTAIETEFQLRHPTLSAASKVKVAYFDKEGWCIAVVVVQSSASVPTSFGGLRVVKGVSQSSGVIKWVRM